MKKSRILTASLAAVSLLTVSACVTDPNTGEKKISRTVLGSVGGAAVGGLLGGVIGGKTGRIIGAVGGAAAAGYVGYKMDQQIKELKEQTAGSGVDVTEVDGGEAILVNLPDGVTFATGSYEINSTFRATLDTVAASMVQYPSSLVDVYGYTDSTGADDFNQRLSEQRAQAVASYLIGRGVASSRLRWQGFGENPQYFKGDNSTEYGRSLNRRVEIKIIPFDQQDVQEAQQQGN
ncbi:OmpA family protein [Qipengyuania marisflavi]|uniref:17 kDa surface antigen n=1 Tax=Qipengyuania marisflavi TaxID=2486356 RepID=A0A5S3P5E0_9SPHN|nr:OmpA family protein [Qipengyuania marisflavi]TMM48136.1 OmpA family protein [Qipengyuania marisflavi]